MRLLDWAEFAKCPVGTVFQVLDHGSGLGELMILGGVYDDDGRPNDYVAAALLPDVRMPDTLGPGEAALVSAHPGATAFVMVPSLHGRDGLFEFKNRSWLVWDDEDRRRLAGWLLDPSAAVERQNDDPVVVVPLTEAQTFLP